MNLATRMGRWLFYIRFNALLFMFILTFCMIVGGGKVLGKLMGIW